MTRKCINMAGMAIISIILVICAHCLKNEDTNQSQSGNPGKLLINEVCSDYFPSSFAESQPAGDWIELYNASNRNINLEEYYLSDNKKDLYKCKLPQIELKPGCYYVVHCENSEMFEGEELLNFKIDAQGETLFLSDTEGVVDAVNVPAMNTNTSWSRLKDASEQWGNTELTYNFSNNQAKLITDEIEAPFFSVESGFYEKEFELELRAPFGSKVYYTMDGSDPNNESILYQNPILVKNVTGEDNVYSTRDDFNVWHEGKADDIVEKITVIRAIAIDAKGNKSKIVTNSYIVGRENNKSYTEMYTVSLVTDPYNLFDYKEGIYVLGEAYDTFVAEGGNLDDGMQVEANYRITGKKSERPASIEIFDEKGCKVLDKNIGTRIHGGTTRACAQKSFSVYAREMYDGENTIKNLFGENTDVHKFFIYSNRDETKLRDTLISKMLADRDIATQSLIYCNVFLNGEYWGIYLLAEVYDEYYFENHFGISRDNIEIYEGTPPSDVIEYLSTVSNASDPIVYKNLCQMIDMQSFIDYYASMLYLNDTDWLGYNARCYRSIEEGKGENEDGKWRWGVWDTESTMYDASVNTFHTGHMASWEDDMLAQALMKHEEFRKQFVITYMDLYNNVWQEDKILPVISEMEQDIAESYEMHSKRFYSGNDKDASRNSVKSFFSERDEYAFEHLKEEFELCGDQVWLVILSNKDGAASFRINTSIIDIPEKWWQGLYFTDYPVEIELEAVNGNNQFLGWYSEQNELLSTDTMITVHLSEETNVICPKFAED